MCVSLYIIWTFGVLLFTEGEFPDKINPTLNVWSFEIGTVYGNLTDKLS